MTDEPVVMKWDFSDHPTSKIDPPRLTWGDIETKAADKGLALHINHVTKALGLPFDALNEDTSRIRNGLPSYLVDGHTPAVYYSDLKRWMERGKSKGARAAMKSVMAETKRRAN